MLRKTSYPFNALIQKIGVFFWNLIFKFSWLTLRLERRARKRVDWRDNVAGSDLCVNKLPVNARWWRSKLIIQSDKFWQSHCQKTPDPNKQSSLRGRPDDNFVTFRDNSLFAEASDAPLSSWRYTSRFRLLKKHGEKNCKGRLQLFWVSLKVRKTYIMPFWSYDSKYAYLKISMNDFSIMAVLDSGKNLPKLPPGSALGHPSIPRYVICNSNETP